jgi:hypothetical protein
MALACGHPSPAPGAQGGTCLGESCAGQDAAPPPARPPIPVSLSTRRLRRLSTREYNNVVRDLLGDGSRPARQFIAEVYQNGYDNGSAGLAVQSDQVVGYQQAAEALAAAAVDTALDRLLGDCDVIAQGEAACEDAFVEAFAPRAYRRPLTETEALNLRAAFAIGASEGGFSTGLRTALEVVLQSPQFLYREELGPLAAIGGGTVQLTDYEIASELSFMLTGSIPDDELWKAVEQGRFNGAGDYTREASRLFSTPAAKETLGAFLHEWLTTNRLVRVRKDPSFYPTFNQDMAGSMTGELDRFYASALSSGSLRSLFMSNESFADGTLARIYGVPVTGTEFQPVTLDPQLRKGILSRAGFLAVHADTDGSGPVSRGVFVLQSILCSPPAPPPPTVAPVVPASDPRAKTLTTRERFAEHVSNAACASCHRTIDGLGFGFEEFDGIGVYRAVENGVPIDSTGIIIGTGEIDGEYGGAGELATRLAGSRHVVDCYVKQVYRYAMGETEPHGDDPASLAWLKTDFSPDSKITDLLLNLVKSQVFVTRTFE